MNKLKIRFDFVQVLMIAKRARYKCASNYGMNIDMAIEKDLLSAELDALGKEEEKLLSEIKERRRRKSNE